MQQIRNHDSMVVAWRYYPLCIIGQLCLHKLTAVLLLVCANITDQFSCFTFVNLFVVEGELSSPDSTTIKLSTASISSNFGLSILIVTEYEPIIHDISCLILQGNFAPLFKAPDEHFSEIT